MIQRMRTQIVTEQLKFANEQIGEAMPTIALKKRVLNNRKFEREHQKADDAIIKALIRARTMSKMSQ